MSPSEVGTQSRSWDQSGYASADGEYEQTSATDYFPSSASSSTFPALDDGIPSVKSMYFSEHAHGGFQRYLPSADPGLVNGLAVVSTGTDGCLSAGSYVDYPAVLPGYGSRGFITPSILDTEADSEPLMLGGRINGRSPAVDADGYYHSGDDGYAAEAAVDVRVGDAFEGPSSEVHSRPIEAKTAVSGKARTSSPNTNSVSVAASSKSKRKDPASSMSNKRRKRASKPANQTVVSTETLTAQLRSTSRKVRQATASHGSAVSPKDRARNSHNNVERDYRNRLNGQFQRLLAVLPVPVDGTDEQQARNRAAVALDRRVSKGRVLDMACRHILSLEKKISELEREAQDSARALHPAHPWLPAYDRGSNPIPGCNS